jgi:hypothetical protein
MNAPFRRMKMCHMIATTDQELHAMAKAIGVARRWYQGDHYDICLSMKAKALSLGALEITWRDCGLMMTLRHRDHSAPLVTPAEGLAILKERFEC